MLIWLKLETPPSKSWHLHSICLQPAHPKTHTLSHKQREEEDLSIRRPFRVNNLQTFQALKGKSNPKQVTQEFNQMMEEEDLPFRTPFFSSISKQHKPQTTKTTQNKQFKMQLQPFFFYHTTKKSTCTFPSNIQLSGKTFSFYWFKSDIFQL
jgi:hypothetical protein